MPLSWAWQTTGREANIPELVAAGRLSGKYLELSDPDRLVPVFIKPEWTSIVVAGDPWRNQVRGVGNNHISGVPISKRVRLPANWHARATMPETAGSISGTIRI